MTPARSECKETGTTIDTGKTINMLSFPKTSGGDVNKRKIPTRLNLDIVMSTAVVPKASYNEGPIAPNVCVCV